MQTSPHCLNCFHCCLCSFSVFLLECHSPKHKWWYIYIFSTSSRNTCLKTILKTESFPSLTFLSEIGLGFSTSVLLFLKGIVLPIFLIYENSFLLSLSNGMLLYLLLGWSLWFAQTEGERTAVGCRAVSKHPKHQNFQDRKWIGLWVT